MLAPVMYRRTLETGGFQLVRATQYYAEYERGDMSISISDYAAVPMAEIGMGYLVSATVDGEECIRHRVRELGDAYHAAYNCAGGYLGPIHPVVPDEDYDRQPFPNSCVVKTDTDTDVE